MSNKYRDYEIVRSGKLKIPKVISGDVGYCLMFGHNPPRYHNDQTACNPTPVEYDYRTIVRIEQHFEIDPPKHYEEDEAPGE